MKQPPRITYQQWLDKINAGEKDYPDNLVPDPENYLAFPEIIDYPLPTLSEWTKERKIIDLSPTYSPRGLIWCLINSGDSLRGCWLDLATAQRWASLGIVFSIDLWTLSSNLSDSSERVQPGKRYGGEFVYCPKCDRWDVIGIQRSNCNLCGSRVEYVASNRWSCSGFYLNDNGFSSKCLGRGQTPVFVGEECPWGCGTLLKTIKKANIGLCYHKLTQITDTEYTEETCLVGNAVLQPSHKQKMSRDREKVRTRLTRGSLGGERTLIGQSVNITEYLINPLTDLPERDLNNKVVAAEHTLKCDECESIICFNKRYEKECSSCGLLASAATYIALEIYLNEASMDEPESQGDDDWKLREIARGEAQEKNEYIIHWKREQRRLAGKEEKFDTNEAQLKLWKEASKPEKDDPKLKHKYIPRRKRDLRKEFINYRLWILLNKNGGSIEQANIPHLYAQEFSEYKSLITPRQAEEAVKRLAGEGRISMEKIHGGKIVIIKL